MVDGGDHCHPLLRSVVRARICHKSWWGNSRGRLLHPETNRLRSSGSWRIIPEIGLKPVVVLSSSYPTRPRHNPAGRGYSARCCSGGPAAWSVPVIALPDAGSGKLLEELEKFESIFLV